MRCPVDSLPIKRQLVFKSHIDSPSEREKAKAEKKRLREKKIELVNRKKEAREAERKRRAQEKMKRLQARKEKASSKKVKLPTTEKKKAVAASKVKRAKKVTCLNSATVEELSAQPPVVEEHQEVAPESTPEETNSSFIELAHEESKQEEQSNFNFFRLLSEFQILKEVKNEEQEPKEQPGEHQLQVEIELQEIGESDEEEARDQPAEEASPEKEETQFAKDLKVLEDMGFVDREKNVALLVRNVGNLDETINQLLNPQPFAALTKWLPFSIGF